MAGLKQHIGVPELEAKLDRLPDLKLDNTLQEEIAKFAGLCKRFCPDAKWQQALSVKVLPKLQYLVLRQRLRSLQKVGAQHEQHACCAIRPSMQVPYILHTV